jgi:hypothetical protein
LKVCFWIGSVHVGHAITGTDTHDGAASRKRNAYWDNSPFQKRIN